VGLLTNRLLNLSYISAVAAYSFLVNNETLTVVRSVMSHFTDESWFDFVRRLLPAHQMDLMRTHLAEGCSHCRELHAVWRRVASITARESDYEPDDCDVGLALAAFGDRRPAAMSTHRLPPYVVYDSFRDAAPAGVRSVLIHARHLLYEVDKWSVALRLKAEPGNQVSLAGHVTQRGASGSEGGLQIKVTSGNALMAKTITNGVGEFYLQCPGRKHLQLHVRLREQEELRIDLPDP
jgi:hypothetical protein